MPQADDDTDEVDYDAIRRQNLIVLVFVIALLGACLWTLDWLIDTSKLQTCIEAGHRNCGTQIQ